MTGRHRGAAGQDREPAPEAKGAAALTVEDATDGDAAAIALILNAAIADTLSVWRETPVTAQDRAAWLAQRRAGGFPVLVARVGGEMLGFATFGPFRQGDGYALTVEHSVHVATAARRRGVATRLMEALIGRAEAAGLHVMVGGVEAGNQPSLALHRRLGFEVSGRLPEVGRKFGRFLDLALVTRRLDPP